MRSARSGARLTASDGARASMLFDQLTRLDDPEPHVGSVNMAIDETLLRCASRPLLRVYRWARPAVSFGYFSRYELVAARWKTRELVRRWTGGGEVLHGEDCTYTLIVPRSHPFSRIGAVASYRAIHQAIASLFVEGRLAASAEPKISESCFENAARFDLIVAGRKAAGAAQRRTVLGLLHQGSIHHREAMFPGFAERLGAALAARPIGETVTRETLAAAKALAETKYGTEAWLRRFGAGSGRAKETLAQ